jgi:HEAT repeat protein
VDGLIKTLRDQDEDVRMQAAWAIGAIGDRRASDALAAALKDASPKVRRQAAWALGAMGRR